MPRTASVGWVDAGGEHLAAEVVGLGRDQVEALKVEHPPVVDGDGSATLSDGFLDALTLACLGEEDIEGRWLWSPADWAFLVDTALSVSDMDDGADFSDRLEWDSRLRQELDFCDRHGIPHSVFLGRVVGEGDPFWLPEDRDKAVSYARWKAEFCVCGTRKRDWEKDPFAFVATSERCTGCELVEMEQAQVAELDADDRRGVKSFLIPNPEREG